MCGHSFLSLEFTSLDGLIDWYWKQYNKKDLGKVNEDDECSFLLAVQCYSYCDEIVDSI